METDLCLFKDLDTEEEHYGILVNGEYIICLCCGGVVEQVETDIIKIFKEWKPLTFS